MGHPLENPKHEKVARLSSTGDRTRIEAYMEVYGASRKVAQNRCGSAWWTASGIAERVKQLQADLASGAVEAAVFEREWLHSQLKTVITRCMQGEEILCNGIPTGEWKFDPNNALKGIELADRAAKGGPHAHQGDPESARGRRSGREHDRRRAAGREGAARCDLP